MDCGRRELFNAAAGHAVGAGQHGGCQQLRRLSNMAKEPLAELDARFSSPGVSPTRWAEGRRRLEEAEVYWLSTVRPDGRPHVTPLLSVWLDGAMYFCTGPSERKAKNLARNGDPELRALLTAPRGEDLWPVSLPVCQSPRVSQTATVRSSCCGVGGEAGEERFCCFR